MITKNLLRKIYKKTEELLSGRGIDNYQLVKVVNNYVKSSLKSEFAIIDGDKIFVDPRDSLRLTINGIYEKFETNFVKNEIKKNNVVLDLGAHVGYYTLMFAKLVGENGKVYAFEPSPTNFELLQKNVMINNYKNVILEKKAISDKSEIASLYLSEENFSDNRIFDSHDKRKSIKIETTTLDDYFKEYDGRIDFIKMDVQGAEGKVLLGMNNLLKKLKHVKIMTEFSPKHLVHIGMGSEEFLDIFLNSGFKLYHMNRKKKTISMITKNELIKKFTPEKRNFTNLLCIK